MVKNHKLAKSISDAAWSQFAEWLEYFGKVYSKTVIAVPPQYTSQKCSNCGDIVKKTLSTRTHICGCGTILDRDHNAGRNILAKGLKARAGIHLNTVGHTGIYARKPSSTRWWRQNRDKFDWLIQESPRLDSRGVSRFKTELNQKDPPRTVNIKTVGIQGLNQSEMPALHARKARTIIVRCGFYTLGECRDLCGFRLWTPSAAKKPAACRIALSSIPNCTIAGPDRGNSSQSLGQHTVFPISDNGFKEDSLAACREI